MSAWLSHIVQIALLRAGPQDLPVSPVSLALACTAWWLLTLLMLASAHSPPAFAHALIAFGLQIAAILTVLTLGRRPERFNQTAAALFGTGALIGLLNVPLWLVSSPPVPAGLVLVALIGLFWSLAVDGHVWRHALGLPYAGGLALAVLLFLIQIVALQALGSST